MEAALKPGSNGGFPCFKTSCWRRADRQRVLISSARLITWPWIVWNSINSDGDSPIVSVDGDAPIVSSFDHLALDLVEFVQTVGPKFQTGLPVCSGGLNCLSSEMPCEADMCLAWADIRTPGLPGCAKEGRSNPRPIVQSDMATSPAHAIHQPQVALLTPTIECHRRSWHNPAASTIRTGHGQEIGKTANISVG